MYACVLTHKLTLDFDRECNVEMLNVET